MTQGGTLSGNRGVIRTEEVLAESLALDHSRHMELDASSDEASSDKSQVVRLKVWTSDRQQAVGLVATDQTGRIMTSGTQIVLDYPSRTSSHIVSVCRKLEPKLAVAYCWKV